MNLFPYEIQEFSIQKFSEQNLWNLKMINVESFWNNPNGSKGDDIVIAVVDTGLDVNHKEFTGRIIGAKNFTSIESIDNVKDVEGHGTHVAGTIAGKTTGVAPEARIMPLKVFGDAKVNLNIQEAFIHILRWNETAKEKDKVVAVNCSFGGSYDPMMHYLIRRLINSGVAVIVAAGNSGDGRADTIEFASYPSFLYEVITTGAIEESGNPAGYSNTHDGIDVGAPGSLIYSAWPNNEYRLLSGTSMATPHVTALYGLIVASFKKREKRYPTVKEVESILFKHIKKVNIDSAFVGEGIIDATFITNRWPLYRCQVGAYYNKSGCDQILQQVKNANFNTYMAKY